MNFYSINPLNFRHCVDARGRRKNKDPSTVEHAFTNNTEKLMPSQIPIRHWERPLTKAHLVKTSYSSLFLLQ